jgi:hypothetical protein
VEQRNYQKLKPGDRIVLKENVLPHVKTREWVFHEDEDDSVFLMHERQAYELSVKKEHIDWERSGQ